MSESRVRVTYGVERLGALSDGVFAIVLTLLVLELKVPDVSASTMQQEKAQLALALQQQLPALVAWLISFVFIARFWVAHHAILGTLAKCHSGTMALNFLVLAVVSLVPFGADLIGDYVLDPLAVGLFSVIFGLAGVSLGLLARHAARETALRRPGPMPDLRFHWGYHATVLPLIALSAGGALLIDELLGLLIWAVEPLIALMAIFGFRTLPKKED